MKIRIGLVDDHQLFLKSLSLMVNTFSDFEVTVEALNGQDLQDKLKQKNEVPEIMLIDVNMPVMDGIATAAWLHERYPLMHLVALSMNDKDQTIIKMIKGGCCAYLLKDTHPNELEKALVEIYGKGYYNGDISNINFRRLLKADQQKSMDLTAKERHFLQLVCSELTYKQIADQMHLGVRTIDGYREALFEKLHVQSRVGLCLEALRRELVTL
jgi:DNA-binding NarL/FixJ family response regulator